MSTSSTVSLRDQWINTRKENPRLRIRDAASAMGVSEADILASFAGTSVIRLEPRFADIIQQMPSLGKVMCLTRNEACVHERKGIFEGVDVSNKHVGLVVGPDIDLRLFFGPWAFAFSVQEDEAAGFKTSFQFFDHQGLAVFKVYATADSDLAAFEVLTRQFSLPQQEKTLVLLPAKPAPVYKDEEVDGVAFRADWAALKDTHDFFPMLRKYSISRLGALTLAGEFATELNAEVVQRMLEKASADQWEIMVFVGNQGNIQIHTGPVKKIVEIPGWINVMDPDFNLHLKTTDIASVWLVKKPTVDGLVHSLEVFDAGGEMIAQFFGKRKPGVPEATNWREGVLRLAEQFIH